jgi:hypothetical protein
MGISRAAPPFSTRAEVIFLRHIVEVVPGSRSSPSTTCGVVWRRNALGEERIIAEGAIL